MGRALRTPERRHHPRLRIQPGRPVVTARLRTGSPVTVLDASPDGLLVETPVRLLPGRHVDLVVQSGPGQEVRRCLVVHSRVGSIQGAADLKYQAGLCRVWGTNYPSTPGARDREKELLVAAGPLDPQPHAARRGERNPTSGTQVGRGHPHESRSSGSVSSGSTVLVPDRERPSSLPG